MIIRGFFKGSNPFVSAEISLPDIPGQASLVEMALDTGSSLTVLRRSVIDNLGVDVSTDFADRPRESARGIGGREEYVRLRVNLRFIDSVPAPERPYTVFVRVALTPDDAESVPSLLGMDVMDSFRLTVFAAENRVDLELPD